MFVNMSGSACIIVFSRFTRAVFTASSMPARLTRAAETPIAQGNDVFTVLSGLLPESELARRLGEADAAVIMKLGRHLPKVRRALCTAQRLDRAIYVERGTMPGERILPLADTEPEGPAPYFSLICVPGRGRRP